MHKRMTVAESKHGFVVFEKSSNNITAIEVLSALSVAPGLVLTESSCVYFRSNGVVASIEQAAKKVKALPNLQEPVSRLFTAPKDMSIRYQDFSGIWVLRTHDDERRDQHTLDAMVEFAHLLQTVT